MYYHSGASNLSNITRAFPTIFAGLISGLTAVCLLVTGMQASLPMWVALLKYSAAVSVCLTFCVVMVFLGPRMGYKPLFTEEQLFLHAVGPLLAVFSFLSSPFIPQIKSSATFIAVIPTLLYGIFYAANILKNGIGEGEKTNDWYGFAVGDVKSIPVVFAIIMTVTWGLAVGMLAQGYFLKLFENSGFSKTCDISRKT